MGYQVESNDCITEVAGASATVIPPSIGANEGELMLMFVGLSKATTATATIDTPSGWTLQSGFPKTVTALRVYLFKKIAGAGGDSFPELTISAADHRWTVQCWIFDDVDTTTDPFSLGDVQVAQGNAAIDNPDFTLVKTRSWHLSYMAVEDIQPGSVAYIKPPNFASLSAAYRTTGPTEGTDHSCCGGIDFQYEAPSTVIAGIDWSASASDDWIGISMEVLTNGNTAPAKADSSPLELISTASYTQGTDLTWIDAIVDSGVLPDGSTPDTWNFDASVISAPLTFDTSTGVDGTLETITIVGHGLITGMTVFYSKNGGANAIGLTEGARYYVRRISDDAISLWTDRSDCIGNVTTTRANLTAGSGETHHIRQYAINCPAHGMDESMIVRVEANGNTLPTGLTTANRYWVRPISADYVQLCGPVTANVDASGDWYYTATDAATNAQPVALTAAGTGTCVLRECRMYLSMATDSIPRAGNDGTVGNKGPAPGTYLGDLGWNQNWHGYSRTFATPRDMSTEVMAWFGYFYNYAQHDIARIIFIDSDGDRMQWKIGDRSVGQVVSSATISLKQIQPGSSYVQSICELQVGTFNAAAVKHIVYLIKGTNKLLARPSATPFNAGDPYVITRCEVYGGLATAPITLADAALKMRFFSTDLASVPSDLQIVLNGSLQIGDGTHATYFADSEKSLAFPPLANGVTKLYNYRETIGFDVNAAAGDTMLLKNSQLGASAPFRVSYALPATGTYNFDGNTYVLGNVILDADAVYSRQLFVGGDGITDNGAEIHNSTFLVGTDVGADTGLITWGAATDIEDSAFELQTGVTTGHAIKIVTPGTYTFTGLLFSGFGADGTATAAVYNNSGGAVTIVIAGGGSTPTVRNGAGASTTLDVPSAGLNVTSSEANTLLQVFVTGTQTILASTTGTSLNYVHSGETVDIVAQKAGFIPQRVTGLVLSGDVTQAFALVLDYNYDSGHGLTYTTDASWDRATNRLTVPSWSASRTVRRVYSLMIDAFIAETSLRNTAFNLSMNGPTSLFMINGAEGASDASIANLVGGGVRYLDANDIVTAEWTAVLSLGVTPGLQPEYEQVHGGTVNDARATGDVNQTIKTYGDATHGDFDYRGTLQLKVQANGYRQAELDVVETFGLSTLEPTLYSVGLPTIPILGLTLGDPAPTGLSITDDSAAPVSWDAGSGAKDFSITITDAGTNSGETILRWLNYNLSLDATFQGKDPYDWPEMVVQSGARYETLRGNLHMAGGDLVCGVRVIRTGGTPHPDFVRFQSDDGTYSAPLIVDTLTVTSDTAGTLLQVFATGTQTILASTTGVLVAYDHSDETVDIVAQKAGCIPQRVTGVVLSGDMTQAFTMVPDFNYLAGHGLTYTTDASWSRANNQLTVPSWSASRSVRAVYSLMIDSFIAESSLRNTAFNLSMNGPSSLFLINGAEGATEASITNMVGGGVRYLTAAGAIAASWACVQSQGVAPGLQPVYLQVDGGTPVDARATGDVNQLIKIYGDSTHGNLDYQDKLVLKVQANGYRQAETDVLATFGIATLDPVLYSISLATPALADLLLGDPAPTGLSLTDDSAAPVSWDAGSGAKNFSITITDAGTNSGETILRWLNYNLGQSAAFQGKDPFSWPEMVIDNGAAYETLYGTLHTAGGPVPCGVRVIRTGGLPHPDFTRFQSDDGTYSVAPVVARLSVANITAGSRLQIFNVTTDTEMVNEIIAATSYADTYENGTGYTTNDVVRIRLTYTNGVVAKCGWTATVVAAESGWSTTADQNDCPVYNALGIDGSTIADFEADYVDNEVDIIVANNFYISEWYAWWAYNLTTEDGIRYFFNGVTAEDVGNFLINNAVVDIFFDNTSDVEIWALDNRRIRRSDGARPIKNPTSGGGGIDMEWREKVLLAEIPAEFADAVKTAVESDGALLEEIHRIHGLKAGAAMTVTPTSRVAGDISQTITGDGISSSTVTRDP